MNRRQNEVQPGHGTDRDTEYIPTIFLVDDGTLMAEIVERKLSNHGFNVTIYDDPIQALNNLESERPSAIFIDLEAEEIDAIELAIMARRRGFTGYFVMVSASRDRERIATAIGNGANDILSKPIRDFELDLIAEKIRSGVPGSKNSFDVLAAIFETIEQGILVLDSSRRIIFRNSYASNVLRVDHDADASSIIEQNCPDHIFKQCIQGKPAATFIDLSNEKNGQRTLIGLEVIYVDSILPEPCYLILMKDFSQWRKLDELHNRFATYLSHRMRTPLTSLRNSVKILSEECDCMTSEERERLLDIGWRNVEKLISSLDELQKVFMIESEELNVCRSLVKVKRELKPLLEEMERDGRIRGFRIRIPDLAIITGRARLRDFISTAVDAYSKWIGSTTHIECISSIREDFKRLGGVDRRFKITIKPRPCTSSSRGGMNLKDFLSFDEAHLGLVLNRLAAVLEGEIEINNQNSISLLVPMDPQFDREKDIVHNLHSLTERSELTGCELHLVELRIVGVTDGGVYFTGILEESLYSSISSCDIVSKGEEPYSYSIFVMNRSKDELDTLLRSIRDRFSRLCCERGEEIYPSIRWEVKYSKPSGTASELSLSEELIPS
jgi:CheY-like chemotaxis protein